MSLNAQTFSPTQAAIAPAVASPQNGDMPDMLLAKLAHLLSGGSGIKVVSNTAAQTVRTLSITVLADAVFATATADSKTGASVAGLTGVTIPKGTVLPLRLEAWSLTSGSVAAVLA